MCSKQQSYLCLMLGSSNLFKVISAVSGKIEKILGPNSDFCVLEMLLAQPALYNVQTVTHVELIRISCEDFKEVLKKFPQVATDIEIAVKETTKQLVSS